MFAGGPFTDALRELETPDSPPAVRGAAGTHLVLPGYYSPNAVGLLDINTSDGRFLFFLPWQALSPLENNLNSSSSLVPTNQLSPALSSLARAPG